MEITSKKAASIHYTLKNKNGEVLDTSDGRGPLSYIHGIGNLIPGMEKGLEGKAAGDKVSLVIAPEDAYGVHDEKLISVVPLENFPEKENVKPGVQFMAQSDQGSRTATVVKVEENDVTVNFNHPLAGEELHFDVEIIDVRDATEEELSHGHIHGEGCNH